MKIWSSQWYCKLTRKRNTTGTHTTVKLLWFVKKNKNIEIGHKKKKLKLVKL